MQKSPLLSVVSPVYKAEKVLPILVERIKVAVGSITEDFEIILVEDRGPDNSWHRILEEAAKDSRVKGFRLSKNFGQHPAITAGLDQATGEWVVVMDCDLQDQPEEIRKLYNKALEGYDVVLAKRTDRQDHYFKRLFSKLFYKTLSYLTGVEHDSSVANFGIYNQKVIRAICSMRESIRYFITMVKWVGFNTAAIEIEHAPRQEGSSSYNFKRLLDLALNIILAYSDKPLRLTVKAGLIISSVSFLFVFYNIFKALTGGIVVMGYASLVVSIWLLAGIIISILGVVGLYLGKTFEGVKQRPIYIIDQSVNE